MPAIAILEPNLPWVESNEDRNFRRLTITLLIIFLVAGLVLDSLTLPEVTQKKLIDVSPRLARLILEKQKIKPPPAKIEKPRAEEKKKVEEPKQKKKQKPRVEKKKAPKKRTKAAREVAQQSGLIALSDELADLRESFALGNIFQQPQQTTGKQAIKITSASNLLNDQAKKSSGGITTSTLTSKIKNSELATRNTTNVTSNIKSKVAGKVSGVGQSSRVAKRSAEEVERVFQKNKGAIFSIYNRALRKNPSLEGKFVVELTIEPNGDVIKVVIISSELGDKKLERKLVLKIKKFKFAKAKVSRVTVSYPIDFLPS